MDTALTGIAAASVIVALVAAIGAAAPVLPRRIYPLLAVALGVAWNCAASATIDGAFGWSDVLYGIIAGLAASGLYSAAVKPAADAFRGAS